MLDPVAQGLSYVGTWAAVWLAIALVVAIVRRRAEVLLATLAAGLVASLTSDLIKAATSRDRPDVDTLVSRPHTSSFPSGHAATSFACATVLASFEPRLRVPLYVLAALIALSRDVRRRALPARRACGRGVGAARRLGVRQSSSTARSRPPTITPSAASRLIQRPIPRPSAGSTSSGM